MNDGTLKVTKLGYSIPISDEWLHPEKYKPKGHEVRRRKSKAWLAERAQFVADWEAMNARGIEAGFIEAEPCYECAGELKPTTHTVEYEWVPDAS